MERGAESCDTECFGGSDTVSLSPTIMYSERIEGGLSVVLAHFVSLLALLITFCTFVFQMLQAD